MNNLGSALINALTIALVNVQGECPTNRFPLPTDSLSPSFGFIDTFLISLATKPCVSEHNVMPRLSGTVLHCGQPQPDQWTTSIKVWNLPSPAAADMAAACGLIRGGLMSRGAPSWWVLRGGGRAGHHPQTLATLL